MKKRILSIILTIMLLISSVPFASVPAHAAESGTCGDNLTWTLDDEGTLTISGSGSMKDYFRTDTPWYSYINSIKNVIIEEGVTSIGDYAFWNCTSLESITIPDSIKSIGNYAFDYCSKLTYISIPENLTSIGIWAFDGCRSLNIINITDVKAWCNIDFGNSTSNPLYYAQKLYLNGVPVTDLIIPEDVTSIGNWAFYNCSSLKSIIIPDSVTSIGTDALSGCSSLTSITIPDNITSIESRVFYNCSSLKSIIIPDSVTSIGTEALSGCSSLTSITIPESVTSIGASAFYGCSSLKSIIIPESVTKIQYMAFYNCSSLETVYFGGTSEQWGNLEIVIKNDPLLNAEIIFEYKNSEPVVPGDPDGDGEVTTRDVLAIRKALGGLADLTPELESAADVDGDGEVTTRDVLKIRKFLGGLIDEL